MAQKFFFAPHPAILVFFAFLFGCQAKPRNDKNLPAPGRERLPQIYVFWDSSNTNLQLPWAPPDPELFSAEVETTNGLAARVVVENSSDPALLEARVRDWNSRPHDLIVVGPNPALYEKLRTLDIPTSQASGHRIFVTDEKTASKLSPKTKLWDIATIDEAPAVHFLQGLCSSKIALLKTGCSFSTAAKKRPELMKLPVGDVSVQFSDFKPVVAGIPANESMVSLSIAWDRYFRNAIRSDSTGHLKANLQSLRFSDGLVQVRLAQNVPEELSKGVKLLTLQLLMGGDGQ